ncbi:Protein IVY1 [Lachnellula cervina]|uniref:Protein IVY1 n=1 Tax=Lachnellula cervina TaxID=1316786 RepID=A0A7D8UQS4_9HELO|nr:Protein IVY1 [Lachnellula cervina]
MTTPTSPSALPPIPSSPTYSYASTANPIPSSFNLPPPPPPRPLHSILTKSDLEASQTAYTDLLTSAKAYRLALATLSSSASTFGSALEACARLKEARCPSINTPGGSMSASFTGHSGACTADSLLAASGVHHLIANHQQILSETVYRSFEVPLLSELDGWRRRMEEEEERYVKEAKSMSKEIRKMEKEGLRLHGKRKRDVGAFREHLVRLTGQLDGLTALHGGHAGDLLREGQEISSGIVEGAAGLVRAEVDIFEALARKGWSGGGLDELLERGRDLFANDADGDVHAGTHSKIFSILPQKSILVDSPDGSGRTGHARSDSLLVEGTAYQSLAGAVRDTDVNSLFSERDTSATAGILNRPRGARPFSPPPSERIPVTERDPLELDRPDAEPHKDSAEELSTSPNTMVLISPPDEERGRDTNGSASASRSGSGESRPEKKKERERRWSDTADGVPSE